MSIDNPYEAPLAEISAQPKWDLAEKTYGGIGRGLYFGLGFLIWLASVVFLVVFTLALPDYEFQASLVSFLAQSVGIIYLTGLRIRNMGQSAWWGLTIIIPLYGLIVLIRCLAYPEGWSDHRTLDSTGKIIGGLIAAAIILPLVLIIGFAIIG